MGQSPFWEANRFSVSQEIPRVLWNTNVHYRIHKGPPSIPILNQINPVHAPTFNFLKIQLNIIIPSKPRSFKWFFSLRFPHQTPVYNAPLPHTCYIPIPSHSSPQYLFIIYIYSVPHVCFGVPHTFIRENLRALCLKPPAVRQLFPVVNTVIALWNIGGSPLFLLNLK